MISQAVVYSLGHRQAGYLLRKAVGTPSKLDRARQKAYRLTDQGFGEHGVRYPATQSCQWLHCNREAGIGADLTRRIISIPG